MLLLMLQKLRHRYHLVDESPWPFLVFTASLFLTLGAVLFFPSDYDEDLAFCVVSFMSLAKKIKPKVLYLGGSVLGSNLINRNYTFGPIGIGKAQWDPDNYSKETQSVINHLLIALKNSDKKSAYDIIYAVLGNKDGIFTQNYGKVSSIVNNMIFSYNRENPKNTISEKEFLDYYGYNYNEFDLSFLDKTNRGTIMSNISEILAPQIIMNDRNDILVERCFNASDKINLSGQKNPEYSIGLFIKDTSSLKITLIVYDSDLKLTEDFSLNQQYKDLISIKEHSFGLGLNVVIVASRDKQDSEIILNKDQINFLLNEFSKLANKYPVHFEKFNNTFISEFRNSGKISLLNKSDFPVVRYYRPIEFYKLPHDDKKFEESNIYLTVVKYNTERDFISSSIEIQSDDVIN